MQRITSVFLLLLSGAVVEADPIGNLTMQISPGSTVFLPGNYNLTYIEPQNWIAAWVFDQNASGAPSALNFTGNQCYGAHPVGPPPPNCQDNDFSLTMGTGNGRAPLTVGSYSNAQGDTTISSAQPLLSWEFRHTAPGPTSGSFTVTKFVYHYDLSNNPVVDKFAATFNSVVAGGGPTVNGQIVFDANPVPEPRTAALLVGGGILTAGLKMRRHRRPA